MPTLKILDKIILSLYSDDRNFGLVLYTWNTKFEVGFRLYLFKFVLEIDFEKSSYGSR